MESVPLYLYGSTGELSGVHALEEALPHISNWDSCTLLVCWFVMTADIIWGGLQAELSDSLSSSRVDERFERRLLCEKGGCANEAAFGVRIQDRAATGAEEYQLIMQVHKSGGFSVRCLLWNDCNLLSKLCVAKKWSIRRTWEGSKLPDWGSIIVSRDFLQATYEEGLRFESPRICLECRQDSV